MCFVKYAAPTIQKIMEIAELECKKIDEKISSYEKIIRVLKSINKSENTNQSVKIKGIIAKRKAKRYVDS